MSFVTVLLFILGVAALAWLVFRRYEGIHLPSVRLKRGSKSRPRPKKPSAPVTGVCSECGKEVTLPFKCKYCNKLFCSDHRLPESHSCPGV